MEERIEVFWHGSTRSRAERIVDQGAFNVGPDPVYLAAGHSGNKLATFFALRAADKAPAEGGPALVRLEMMEEDARRFRDLKLLGPKPFDPADPPEIRGQTQWLLQPGGVERFCAMVEEWTVHAVPLRA